jgi:hypothetical protein
MNDKWERQTAHLLSIGFGRSVSRLNALDKSVVSRVLRSSRELYSLENSQWG